ncbi:hypothetical protein COU60_05315 [Candidatus Pacearchaeota archaeon CG10_big_fil_rev_8_21_14_0_10_34_76]|nr:MAG: hypothetical protein COU60_05315 [Candidatus Pacearchaeota archaeon CG10_big_fil_rev_8_21_14_0_10_34_76]
MKKREKQNQYPIFIKRYWWIFLLIILGIFLIINDNAELSPLEKGPIQGPPGEEIAPWEEWSLECGESKNRVAYGTSGYKINLVDDYFSMSGWNGDMDDAREDCENFAVDHPQSWEDKIRGHADSSGYEAKESCDRMAAREFATLSCIEDDEDNTECFKMVDPDPPECDFNIGTVTGPFFTNGRQGDGTQWATCYARVSASTAKNLIFACVKPL